MARNFSLINMFIYATPKFRVIEQPRMCTVNNVIVIHALLIEIRRLFRNLTMYTSRTYQWYCHNRHNMHIKRYKISVCGFCVFGWTHPDELIGMTNYIVVRDRLSNMLCMHYESLQARVLVACAPVHTFHHRKCITRLRFTAHSPT